MYDQNYLFGTEVLTPLPQIVKFEAQGQLSSEYGIARNGAVSVSWTPAANDILYAKLYDQNGNVLAMDEIQPIPSGDGGNGDDGGDDDSGDDGGGGYAEDSCNCNLTSGDWVDLGLPSGLLWATCNVGASSPTDYGNYYNTGNGDDAAASYGGRMPTYEEWVELLQHTTGRWVTLQHTAMPAMPWGETLNEVNGLCFTGANGNSLFLPAAGYNYAGLRYFGERGLYISSTTGAPDYPQFRRYFYFIQNHHYELLSDYQSSGCSVRAVR